MELQKQQTDQDYAAKHEIVRERRRSNHGAIRNRNGLPVRQAQRYGPQLARKLEDRQMNHRRRFKKDYYGGALMSLTGLAALMAGLQYRTGTLSRMGPGFFPVAVGTLLASVGILIALSARGDNQHETQPVGGGHSHVQGAPDLRGGLCIVLGVLAFLVLGNFCGLIPATFAIVLISALGDRDNTLMQAVLLALAMCIVAAVVFWWALKLQLPLFSWRV